MARFHEGSWPAGQEMASRAAMIKVLGKLGILELKIGETRIINETLVERREDGNTPSLLGSNQAASQPAENCFHET